MADRSEGLSHGSERNSYLLPTDADFSIAVCVSRSWWLLADISVADTRTPLFITWHNPADFPTVKVLQEAEEARGKRRRSLTLANFRQPPFFFFSVFFFSSFFFVLESYRYRWKMTSRVEIIRKILRSQTNFLSAMRLNLKLRVGSLARKMEF